ncbi:MAG: 4-alpha-glucanotransferase [Rhodospirillales bacterium]|nr:MAG: 4-alpha-glucanotransferase [Rhodospirillales bacterium]
MAKSSEALHHLAEMAGLEPRYWDIWGNLHEAGDATKRTILAAMGIDAEDDQAVADSIHAFEERPWLRPLPPVLVVRLGETATITMSLAAGSVRQDVTLELKTEQGDHHRLVFRPVDLPVGGSRTVRGERIERRQLQLPWTLPTGYHEVFLTEIDWKPMRLIVVPHQCFLPKAFARGKRLWGIAAHVYSLRSANDWGIGDFGSLRTLVDSAASLGAAAIGVNPLHALFPHDPERASPYSPSSRLFLNQIFLDVAGMPDLAASPAARKRVEERQGEIATLRALPRVDYTRVTALKHEICEDIFADFLRRTRLDRNGDPDDPGFRQFRDAEGAERLRRFAIYQALSEHFDGLPWQEWPDDYRDPCSSAVATFAKAQRERVAFFEYLQWQADLQLAAVQERAVRDGLAIGLYRDLAVGVDPGGADAWSDQDVVVGAVHVGAPPDPFNMMGQDWGLPPLNPRTLEEQAYEPFIAMVRANMRHAGALRIDHVMGLLHLYWIPAGAPAAEGVYVAYPFEDLLGILSLESERAGCMVIGEDLGTVPPGFRDRMAECNILSYRVLYFEKDDDRFKEPQSYPKLALACVTTHDLATLAGFWKGTDIGLRRDLALYPSPAIEQSEWSARISDRRALVTAVTEAGLLPADAQSALSDGIMAPALIAAVHGYLALSPALLMMVQIDDITLEEEQLNLPGTVDERPNWRRRLSAPVEELGLTPTMRLLRDMLKQRHQEGLRTQTTR